jgi:hypothetical protein
MQSSDLKVSIIRSDYPSNAQGNDQRELLPYVLNIYPAFSIQTTSQVYPSIQMASQVHPTLKMTSQVQSKRSRLPFFTGEDQAIKSGSSFDAFDHLRASNASIRTKNLANFLEYFSDN